MALSIISTAVQCRKASYMAENIVNNLSGITSVLDIGCGDGVVGTLLSDGIDYSGIDIGAEIYPESDAENVTYLRSEEKIDAALDSMDTSFDAVLLFDVLEHTPQFIDLFDRACAKSQKFVVVSLPNEFNAFCRLRFLMGQGFETQSVELANYPDGHRHMWVVCPDIAKKLLANRAAEFGFSLKDEYLWRLMPKNLMKRALYSLCMALTSPSSWSFHSVFVFAKGD
jgi:2-polyprenyl-3-methyl-5-hydroxy-6-metoxy-1,4-benzoquinol methylase